MRMRRTWRRRRRRASLGMRTSLGMRMRRRTAPTRDQRAPSRLVSSHLDPLTPGSKRKRADSDDGDAVSSFPIPVEEIAEQPLYGIAESDFPVCCVLCPERVLKNAHMADEHLGSAVSWQLEGRGCGAVRPVPMALGRCAGNPCCGGEMCHASRDFSQGQR
jgi:hypothetical protein